MKTALIGYTGFVGSNIGQEMTFDDYYNSKNIHEIVGKEYDLVISTGIVAEKYLANAYPEEDLKKIQEFLAILCQVSIKQLVFISTIDVYKTPIGADETSNMETEALHAYGKNRLYAESVVRDKFPNALIVRLPALFGIHLKKNFIYDFLTKIPTMLTANAFEKLRNQLTSKEAELLETSYRVGVSGNWNVIDQGNPELKELFERYNATSLNFTDARSQFQFYDLQHLVSDIQTALDNNIHLLNITSEPVSALEIAQEVFHSDWNNQIDNREPVLYDLKSIHASTYGGRNGYLYTREMILRDLKSFVEKVRQ